MDVESKIYIAGHKGMVGSAIFRKLKQEGYKNLLIRTHKDLDLSNQEQVRTFFKIEKPEYIFLAAAKVGGILANINYPAEFIYENLAIQTNLIHQSYLHCVKKLLFLGSSCVYPRNAPQPIKEEYFLTGELESTNESYAIAKIAGIKMCQAYNLQYGTNYISVMPTNLYGPGDNFDLNTSHVLAALIRKFYEADRKEIPFVEIWGSGKPRREFLYVDDLADACLFLMNNYNENSLINIGTGFDVSILKLAELISSLFGYTGDLIFDETMPDGTQQKLLDVSKISSIGWRHHYNLEDGIRKTIKWYKGNPHIAD